MGGLSVWRRADFGFGRSGGRNVALLAAVVAAQPAARHFPLPGGLRWILQFRLRGRGRRPQTGNPYQGDQNVSFHKAVVLDSGRRLRAPVDAKIKKSPRLPMPAAVFDRRPDLRGREIRRTFPGKRKKHAPPPSLHAADSQRHPKKSGARPRKRHLRLKPALRSETSRRLAHTVPGETTGIGSASRPYHCNKSASEFRSSRNPHSMPPTWAK